MAGAHRLSPPGSPRDARGAELSPHRYGTYETAPLGRVAHNGGVSESRSTDSTAEVRLRRAPRLPVFLLLGAILGAIGTLIITSLSDADPKVGFAASFGYFCLYGVPAGVVLGAVVGLALDRRSVRRARTVTAELERVDRPDASAPTAD